MKNKIKLFISILVICVSIMFSSGNAYADMFGANGTRESVNKVTTEFATKAPFGKREMAMKFLLAMLGVATSSVVIYVGLSLYNRFVYKNKTVVINEDDNDFKTPTNMKEAINIFLKKTK